MQNLSEILDLLVQRHTPNLDYEFPQSFSSFLKTNDLPTESDAKFLGDLSKNVSDALRLITSDMESLIDAHSQLKKIQDHLLRVDDDIKTAIPPIGRLPAEMLIQIFKQASEDGDAFYMRWEPFVISHVCRKWRVVATEKCPEIWTKFSFERGRWDDMKDPVALLSLVLSRGAERSLEFYFEASGGNDVSDCESEKDVPWDEEDEDAPRSSYYRRDDRVTKQLLQDLVRHCHRWSDVHVSIPPRFFHLLSPIRGKLQSLIAFNLYYVADDLLFILTESHILDGAPLLETVSVSCYQSHVPVLVPQGVPNLTSYSDKRQRAGDETLHQRFLNIVRTSPSLQSLCVRHEGSLTVAMPRIVHPSIASLTAADGAFLRSLTLPGLKNMVLYGSTSRSQPDIYYAVSSLYNLIVHSACALSSLRIIISNCAIDQNLIHILEASPDLTSLGLELLTWHGDSVQTIRTLFGRLGSFEHVLIPKLQSLALVLEEANFLGTNFGLFGYLFAYFVEDRWRKGTLRSVTVTIPWTTSSQPEFPLSQACRETLIKLKNEGMDVEFISRGASLLL